MPIKKKEQKHTNSETRFNENFKGKSGKNNAAIIASTTMMILAFPIGTYTLLGWILTLAKTGIGFGSTQHITISAICIAIITILGLFGARKINTLHKLALLAIFILIPFGFYKIIKTILFEYNTYYNEIAIAFGIVFFFMIILVFKRNTD